MRQLMRFGGAIVCGLAVVVAVAGCAPRRAVVPSCCPAYTPPRPAPPPPAPPPAPDVITLEGVHFDFDQATLKPSGRAVLDDAVEILTNRVPPEQAIVVEGHTDSHGSDEYNDSLSERRAQSVRLYLIGRGIDAERISAVGYGEARPIASNQTDEGRAKNRRVEIRLVD